MNITKLAAFLLAAFICAAPLTSCNKKSPDTTETDQTAEAAPYEKGVVENNVYTNKACDLVLRIPTGWTVKSDYDLATLMGITYDFENQDTNLEQISKLADIYDFMATDTTEDISIIVLMQDMKQHSLEDISATEYLETMKGQFTSETATFEIGDISAVHYSGHEYTMMKVESTPTEGTAVTQYFFVREANGRMVSVMLTFPSADPINPDTIFA